ncbi:MAG: ferredoxin [Bdellovibrionales bacterium]
MSYKAHVFICTNQRTAKPGEKARECCASKGAEALRSELKDWAKTRFGNSVRINTAGCLDQCEKGIACVIYPQEIWLTDVEATDADKIKSVLEKIVK